MSKDPAFLFYDGDAARDVSHMNRLERGCYFDLIQAQRKFGGFTVEQIRKILGSDFENCWGAIEIILMRDEAGKFYIEWVRESMINRKEYAEKQRKRIQDYWDKKKEEDKEILPIPEKYHGTTAVVPLENEDVDEDVNNTEIENLYKDVVIFFDENCRPINESQRKEWISVLDKLVRIDKYSPEHIRNIIKRTRMDDFWRGNFLSVLKLRRKNKDGIMYFTVFENKSKKNGQSRIYSESEYDSDRI